MDEVIALENQIRVALIADTVPDSVKPWALDIWRHGWNDRTTTRLERLRTIAAALKQFTRTE